SRSLIVSAVHVYSEGRERLRLVVRRDPWRRCKKEYGAAQGGQRNCRRYRDTHQQHRFHYCVGYPSFEMIDIFASMLSCRRVPFSLLNCRSAQSPHWSAREVPLERTLIMCLNGLDHPR